MLLLYNIMVFFHFWQTFNILGANITMDWNPN